MRTYKKEYKGFRLETHKRPDGSWITWVFKPGSLKAITNRVSYLKKHSIGLSKAAIHYGDV